MAYKHQNNQDNVRSYSVQPMGLGATTTGDVSVNSNSFHQIVARFSSLFEFDPSKPDYTLWGHPKANNGSENNDPAPSSSLSLLKNKFGPIARPYRRRAENSSAAVRSSDEWEAPPEGYYKLNFDGAVNPRAQTAGIGGIIRDANGEIIAAFTGRASHPMEAELQALVEGLLISQRKGIRKIIIECDCLVIVKNLEKLGNLQSWAFTTSWKELLDTLEKFDNWEVKFCRRTENRIADILAKIAYPILAVFSTAVPLEIREVYEQEKEQTKAKIAQCHSLGKSSSRGGQPSWRLGRDLNFYNFFGHPSTDTTQIPPILWARDANYYHFL